MRKLKKKSLVAISLAVAMMLGVAGCGKTKDLTTEEKEFIVHTSTDAEEPTTEDEPIVIVEDPTSEEALAEQERFAQYLDDSFKESVVSDTLTLHYSLAHPAEYGIEEYEITYGDNDMSEEGIAKGKQEAEEDLAELEEFDYDLLTNDQKFLYDMLHENCELNVMSYEYAYLYEPFAYTSGLQANFPITMAEYKFYSEQDIKDYLALLELTPEFFDPYLEFERTKSSMGLFMNTHSAEEVIRQCSEFIENPDENLLLATFVSRLDTVEGLSEEAKAAYIETNTNAVTQYIIPTYQKVIDVFTELKDTGVNDLGLYYFENGQDYYKYLMASKVGTSRTPEEIIDLIDSYLDDAMNELTSLVMTNYNAYLEYFDACEGFYQGEDNKSTIEYFEEVFDESFPDIPDIDFSVSPVHESLENSVSPAFFMTPPLDEYTNNSIYINEGSDGAGALWSTLCHEGVPGHMYQFVYFLSSNPEPIHTLLSFNGYQEGWAQYVENMSFKYYDGYEDPIYADFERINSELNLLVSSRIEIGVNYEGWTLEDTQNYLSESGFNAEVAQDIMDYVVAEPGNYQMYCTGALEFKELRKYAEDKLGDKFDEKEFHKTVLDAGPCQFDLLENKVKEYVQNNK